jgi:hypothetical protein
MSEREWIAPPKDIEVGTRYGPVYISCNGGENDAVYVDAQSNGKALAFAGNQYPMAFHLERRDGEWTLYNACWAVSGHAPPSYKKKMAAEVIRAVGTYLDLHPQLVVQGRRAQANNSLASLEHEIAKLEVTLAERKTAAAALAAELGRIEQRALAPSSPRSANPSEADTRLQAPA